MVVPYTSIQFAVLHKVKSFAAGSSKAGTSLTLNTFVSESLSNNDMHYIHNGTLIHLKNFGFM